MENLPDYYGTIANLLPGTLAEVSAFRHELDATFEGQERHDVEEALWLMCEIHVDQKDRSDGTPYPEHPLDVARNVLRASATADSELVIAGLLHDSVEDQAAKLASKLGENSGPDIEATALRYLEVRFGSRVARIVSALSNPDFEKELVTRGQEATKENKNKLYAAHVEEAIEDPDVLLIKLFDFASNALSLDGVIDPVIKMKLTRKYAPVIAIFINRLQSGQPTNLDGTFQAQFTDRLEQTYLKMQAELAVGQQ